MADVAPRAPLANCGVCPLYQEPHPRRDVFVAGNGPPQADIVFVGEAPGETEMTRGRPFIGASGVLLNKTLENTGLSRAAVFVTNAVLCGKREAGKNVTPPQVAIRACQLRLLEEVRLHRPKVVVLLGAKALSAFGLGDKMGDVRGRERWLSVDALRELALRGRAKNEIANDPVLRAWAVGHEETYLPRPRKGETYPGVDESLHVTEWENGGVYVLPCWHPAFCLRSPDAYPDMQRDFAHLVELVGAQPAQQRELPQVTVHVARTPFEAVQLLGRVGQAKVVAADIECRSKNRLMEPGTLLTVAYAWQEGSEVHALVLPAFDGPVEELHESWAEVHRPALAYNPLVRRALQALHNRRDIRFVWWNGKFDRKWLWQQLGVAVRIDGDGMLAHFGADPRPNIHGLKIRASDDLNASDYEERIAGYTGRGDNYDMGRVPFPELCTYTGSDVGMTLPLTLRYEGDLDEDARRVYEAILLPAASALSDIELVGARVDVGVLRELDGTFAAVIAGYEREMHAVAGSAFAIDSYPQIVQTMYGDEARLKFPSANKKPAEGLPSLRMPLVVGQRNTPDTSSDACDKLLAYHDLDERQQRFVRALRSYKKDGQLYRTYIHRFPEVVGPDGRIRTNFNLHVTRTGRLSSSDPVNLQNIPTRRPEGRRIKESFVAEDGWVLMEADYSQAELRVAAFHSREPALMEVYRTGGDFHHTVAMALLGDETLAKDLREYIKTFNFAMLYGAGVKQLVVLLNDTALAVENETGQAQTRWSVERVQQLYDEFWARFPTFAQWAETQRRHAETRGWVASHFGRKRYWALITRDTIHDVHKEAVNHPVQSGASDLLLLSLVQMHEWCKATGKARIILTVHDSMLLEVRLGHEAEVARQIVHIMEKVVPVEAGFDIPFKADVAFGPRWSKKGMLPPDAYLESLRTTTAAAA